MTEVQNRGEEEVSDVSTISVLWQSQKNLQAKTIMTKYSQRRLKEIAN